MLFTIFFIYLFILFYSPGPERTNEVTVASSNYNGQPADPYARVSKISVDSFESSSTSSDENYENTRNSYVSVAANQCYSYTSKYEWECMNMC